MAVTSVSSSRPGGGLKPAGTVRPGGNAGAGTNRPGGGAGRLPQGGLRREGFEGGAGHDATLGP